jgi:hypothetical protein
MKPVLPFSIEYEEVGALVVVDLIAAIERRNC